MKPTELRRKVKKKIPKFLRQDYPQRMKLHSKKRWAAAKGNFSKVRRKMDGKRSPVLVGFRGPRIARGLHANGLIPIMVNNVKDLLLIKSKEQGAMISAKVGNRTKIEIIKAAEKNKIKILNVRKPEEYLKKTDESMKERKIKRQEKLKKKEELRKLKEKKKKEKKIEETPQEEKEIIDVVPEKKEIKKTPAPKKKTKE